MKPASLLAALLLFTVNVFAQTMSKAQFVAIKRLPIEKDMTNKADLLFRAAQYCLENEELVEKNLDSASLLNRQSMQISKTLNLKKRIFQSMLLDGKIAVAREQSTIGIRLKNKALQYAYGNGLKKEQADVYRSFAADFANKADMAKCAPYFNKALSLYRESGNSYEEAETFMEMSSAYQIDEQLELSSKYATQAIQIKKRIKRYDFYKELYYLGYNFILHGNYDKAMVHLHEAEKIAENKKDRPWIMVIYSLLSSAYNEIKFYDKSLEYNKKALVMAKEDGNKESIRTIVENTASVLYSMGKTAEAFAMIDGELHYKPSKECDMYYSSIYLSLHCKLKQYGKAKPYYENLLRCTEEEYVTIEDRTRKYDVIVNYLIETGQANKAYPYIDTLKQLVKQRNNILVLSEIEKTYYKVDSAQGNYLGAIAHLKKFKSLSDSIFNINSNKQFADLQLKYETEKKEKNIKLLNSQNQLIRIKSEKAHRTKNITFVGIALLLIIVGLLYSRYRIKQKSNRKLEAHQRELDQKNAFLETLNADQDKLIKEKEWLIKEVHHRVKNNLQMVTSLLYSQSMYLKDDAAKLAVEDSLRRMQAMALIHQKLYQDENTSTLAMPEYINDLVHYLQESFDAGNQITFEQTIEPIKLDVSQAIPLGLIVTESIVNAIKYAFISEQKGIVSIALRHDADDHLLLKISDNGIGLPEAFDTTKGNSLGLDLIKGLAKQLNGTIAIENDKGVHISVRFVVLNK